ncbi:hypothetical protein G6F46_010954 [Rhizopus delemar]|uniref:Major facilitator superfamily (MFS) profile domain-containing protein n=2 Tax=Rhizopus TaxID=4842 RepID=A0A9P6YUG8_9FUNG|nr:hypothetical protein G6F55_012051 [Rhizopus delemar]KAG1536331.1 hypothetical protein G6F51_011030 [Rhizopus arrhizus]KAG1490665.1 hypothetical protein G6F54_010562 [Rhizopus delemar]KAG1496128.1 hypothetical protein G6F53_012235 [Rhizopus delemar]KAG1508660.1 hypothetical protein G6F52_011333 [Rhizopus delemar]
MQRKPIFARFRSARLYVLVTVCVSLFTDMITYSIIVPIIPFALESIEHGRSPDNPTSDPYHSELSDPGNISKDSGILLALFSVGLIVGSIGFGYLGDRLKHRQGLMLAGILGLLGSTLLFMLGRLYWELLLARFLQGFSDACVWTLGMCLISDTFPLEELGTQMGRVMMFHSIGMVAGAPIGVERKNNPPEWFEKETVVDSTSKKDGIESTDVTINSQEEKEEIKNQKPVTYLRLLKQHRLLAGMLMAFSNAVVIGTFETTLSIRLATEWGYNSSQIGILFIAEVAPAFIASPLAGMIADKYGPKIVVIPTWLLCSVSLLLTGIPNKSTAGGIAPLVVLLVIQGFCVAAFLTPVLSEIGYVVQSQNPDGGDDGQGRSYGLFNVAFALGGIVGPLLGGYLYSAIGFFWLCIVAGCFLLVCAPYVFFFVGERGKLIVRPPKTNREE